MQFCDTADYKSALLPWATGGELYAALVRRVQTHRNLVASLGFDKPHLEEELLKAQKAWVAIALCPQQRREGSGAFHPRSRFVHET
jgi:hypothetical protein